MPLAVSDVNVPPKGISQSLWDAYREMTISELEGEKRNFRSANPLSVFIKGVPTERDVTALDATLNAFSQNCQNITPRRATVLPSAGVIFHFIKSSDFKTVISTTTQKNSTVQWWYYRGRGINDAIALISTDLPNDENRDFLIRYRLLQSLGFYTLTASEDFSLFAFSNAWEAQNTLTEMDRQLISFYCSTLVRAWDTEVGSQDYINSIWNKTISTAPNFSQKVMWSNTDSGIKVLVQPDGDQSVINHVTKIGYQLIDTQGVVVASEEVEIQDDVFKTREFLVKDLKSFSVYSLKVYSKNLLGKSPLQSVQVSTGALVTEAEKAAAQKVLADAAIAKAAAEKAAAEKLITDAAAKVAADKAAAEKLIADAALAKVAADKAIADAAVAKVAADKAIADAAVAKVAADKAAAEKLISDAKSQAEKILADAKSAAELKAKQEADAKVAIEKAVADAIAAKVAADLKTKQEADAKAAADKLISNQLIADAEAKAAQILLDAKAKSEAAAKAAAAKKMTTITCTKGKLTKKVTAIKPLCPAGYKKK